jgi:hypothetical protein
MRECSKITFEDRLMMRAFGVLAVLFPGRTLEAVARAVDKAVERELTPYLEAMARGLAHPRSWRDL